VICYDISRYAKKKETDMTAFAISGRRHRGHDHVRLMSGARRGRRRRGHFGPGHAGFGRRAGRGDIRAAILALLTEQPMHGYQIIQELAERTDGVWRPSPGSVYPTLQQLEDEELVRETASASGKRVYELTDTGREQAAASPEPWSAIAAESDDALVALRDLVQQVAAATRQVAHAGSATQLDAAQTLLRDVRRSLYRILAEDDADAS
jgi:DNA-binding PadR family transcriptional regulator